MPRKCARSFGEFLERRVAASYRWLYLIPPTLSPFPSSSYFFIFIFIVLDDIPRTSFPLLKFYPAPAYVTFFSIYIYVRMYICIPYPWQCNDPPSPPLFLKRVFHFHLTFSFCFSYCHHFCVSYRLSPILFHPIKKNKYSCLFSFISPFLLFLTRDKNILLEIRKV